MASLLKYGDPGLTKRAKPATGDVRHIVEEIREVMKEHGAIGLSACHIGIFVRIILIYDRIYINPKLSDPSPEKETMEEGSISLPGIQVPIERPKAITIEATDLDGNPIKERLEGLDARVAQHEFDQLNGIFFLSRAQKEEHGSSIKHK